MATKLLEPFIREIVGGKEPNDHQKSFLYLPLPILRTFTNIESIVMDEYITLHAKQPAKRQIDETIEKRHQQMGQLNKWRHWNLSKLEFRLPNTDTDSDAKIWSKSKDDEMDDDREFSAHEKQFVYLPLAILKSATNIRQLFSHIEDEEQSNDLIQKLHTEMSTQVWAPELLNLRFIDTTSAGCNGDVQNVVGVATTDKPMRRTPRSASIKTTAMENHSNIEPVTRQLRKRKVKFIKQ